MNKQDKKELRQQIACEWLEQNYLQYDSLRHDMVMDRLQIRDYKPTPSPCPKGRGEGKLRLIAVREFNERSFEPYRRDKNSQLPIANSL